MINNYHLCNEDQHEAVKSFINEIKNNCDISNEYCEGEKLRKTLIEKIKDLFPTDLQDDVVNVCLGNDSYISREWQKVKNEKSNDNKDKLVLDIMNTIKDQIYGSDTCEEALQKVISYQKDGKAQVLPIFDKEKQEICCFVEKDILMEKICGDSEKHLSGIIHSFLHQIRHEEVDTKTVGYISESKTLSQVKDIMDAVPDCNYLFVTENGKQNEKVIGWVSRNLLIN